MKSLTVRMIETSASKTVEKRAMAILLDVVDKAFNNKKDAKAKTKKAKMEKVLKKFVDSLSEQELQELIDSKDPEKQKEQSAALKEENRYLALAYNMKQTKTNMPKEKIAERAQKHQDWIKKRQERIKALQLRQKSVVDPDKKRNIDQKIASHNFKIKKHQEALKYYKLLGSLKPNAPKEAKEKEKKKPVHNVNKPKENPALHGSKKK